LSKKQLERVVNIARSTRLGTKERARKLQAKQGAIRICQKKKASVALSEKQEREKEKSTARSVL